MPFFYVFLLGTVLTVLTERNTEHTETRLKVIFKYRTFLKKREKMEKIKKDQVRKQIGFINYYPFDDLKVKTKVKISINEGSSVIIIEQSEFLPDIINNEHGIWTKTSSNKIIIHESQYEDFCELIDLGLTFIQKSI